jgi:hypothetical protein
LARRPCPCAHVCPLVLALVVCKSPPRPCTHLSYPLCVRLPPLSRPFPSACPFPPSLCSPRPSCSPSRSPRLCTRLPCPFPPSLCSPRPRARPPSRSPRPCTRSSRSLRPRLLYLILPSLRSSRPCAGSRSSSSSCLLLQASVAGALEAALARLLVVSPWPALWAEPSLWSWVNK